MYLKAIELENFKSFARKHRIELKPGFTAISGPNGSGKSNIGDAILFVLGPKSSKVIRANKLLDLIYDGGKNGRPADYCRVSLIFDNSDRVLPIDEDEVKLTRYIKRANNKIGYDSYFYINDEPARLQDFESLLIHAKIDADGYNFVKQGDVTRIVEMSPIERRKILEDIAGISDFDREIEKAENKKNAVEENMGKIGVLLEEIEKRLETLEKDRQVALKYLELENRLKELKAKIAYAKMMEAKNSIESYSKLLEKYEDKIRNLERELEEKKGELDNIRKLKGEVDKKINEESSGEIEGIKKRVDELKLEAAKIKTKMDDNEDIIQENSNKIKLIREEIKSLKRELNDRERARKELGEKLENAREVYENKKKELEDLEQKISVSNERFRSLSDEIERIGNLIEKKRELYNAKIIERNRAKERLNHLAREIANLESEERNVREGIKDAQWRISEIRSSSKNVEKRRKILSERYHQLKRRRSEIEKEMESIRKEITELNSQLERVRGRMEAHDPLSIATTAVLNARDRGILQGIYGTIAELGTTEEKYRLAIEVAAGNRLMSIVCEDDEAAARAIEYLKKNKLGRAIFLPLNKMLTGRPRGRAILASRDPKSHGFAINLIKFDKKFEPAFWYVFGDTVVVEDLDTARKLMGGVRLVTLDGQLIEASGAMIGGSVEKMRKISMGNVRELTAKLNDAMERERALKNELETIDSEIEEVMREISTLQSVSGADIEVWKKEKNNLEMKLADILKRLGEVREEKMHTEKILRDLEEEIKEIGKEIEDLENKRDSLREERESIVPEKIASDVKSHRKELESLRNEMDMLSRNIIELDGEIKRLRDKLNGYKESLEKLEEKNRNLREANERMIKELNNIAVERRKLEDVLNRMEARIKELIEKSDGYLKKINDIEKEITAITNEIKMSKELKISTLGKVEEERKKYEEARREYESYGIRVDGVEDRGRLEREVKAVELEMTSLGPVNMKSIDEYNYERERYDELRRNYDSLSKEKREIEKLVKELEEKKKYGLLKVYEAINKNFEEIYREMSAGGEAHLVLENPKNPLEGGLTIKVKPVGKGLKRLNALSGGEKSLAALAFIFAIQQYDPSPIYLLDEADMFLDGVNAEILGRIIKRNSRSAQFIVISLRRATIKFADHIIGVTHAGDGISRIFIHDVPEVSESA